MVLCKIILQVLQSDQTPKSHVTDLERPGKGRRPSLLPRLKCPIGSLVYDHGLPGALRTAETMAACPIDYDYGMPRIA
jgi:hypothetical protein